MVISQSSSPRAFPADVLADLARDIFDDEDRVLEHGSLPDAIQAAVDLSEIGGDQFGGVVVAGSVTLVGRGARSARRPGGRLIVAPDLTPSPRPHGAQRMISATILVIEAFVVFFAVLVAHQLSPDERIMTWIWGLLTVLALVACSGMLKRGAWPYWLGLVLQLPDILLGLPGHRHVAGGTAFAALFATASSRGISWTGRRMRRHPGVAARGEGRQGEG